MAEVFVPVINAPVVDQPVIGVKDGGFRCDLHLRLRDQHMLRIVQLPMPSAVEYQGQRLPASYANFYIANGIVIVPTYRDPNDSEAMAILRRVFPDRRVIGIDSTDLIWGLGSFHCISQQEPA